MKIQKYLLWGMAAVGAVAVGMYLYKRNKKQTIAKAPAAPAVPAVKGMNIPMGTAAPDVKPV